MEPDQLLRKRIQETFAATQLRESHEIRREVTRRSSRIRRRRAVVTSLAVCSVLLSTMLGIVWILGRDDGGPANVTASAPDGSAESHPSLSIPASAAVQAAWQELAPGPLGERIEYSAAWTGRELIVWGGWSGTTTHELHADGAAFNPATNTWRMLPAAPGAGRAGAATVWTGSELLILGGETAGGRVADGLSFDPATDTWEQLPSGPLTEPTVKASVWTGSEAVILATTPDETIQVVSYAPQSRTWSALPTPATPVNRSVGLTVSNGRILLFGGVVDELGATAPSGEFALQELDAESGRWQSVTKIGVAAQGADVGVTDGGLAVVDYRLKALTSQDSGRTWQPIGDMPVAPMECTPQTTSTSHGLFVWKCGQAAVLTDSATWVPVTPEALPEGILDATVVWSGEQVLIWARNFDTHTPILRAFDPEQIN